MSSSNFGNVSNSKEQPLGAADDNDFALESQVVITKFDPSPQRTHLIVRQRLTAVLDAQIQGRLTLVIAPAGYGKTTLLADWRRQLKNCGVIVGWLSLDEDDSDAPQVLRCLALALARSGLVRAAKLASSVIFDTTAAKQLLTALLNMIATEDHEVVLILDEFEHLPVAVIEEVFFPCLEKAPPNLHLVIASREMPQLKIANLRAQGLVHEIHANDLRFDLSEIRSVLGDAATNSELQQLETQTSGWPVAIQLLKGVWAQHERRGKVLRELEALDDTLIDYLSEQVFSTLPKDVFKLLVQVSAIDRISPGIVEFMSGSNDAWGLIIKTDALAPFRIPLDTANLEVYRLHPIIRAYFRSQLDTLPREERAATYRRAANWYASAGRLVSALDCAAAAGDTDLSGTLIEEAGGLTIWLRSGLPRLKAIVRALNEDVFASFPRVKLLKAFLFVKEGDVRASRQLFEEIRRETDSFEQDRRGGNASLLKLDSLVLESTLMVNECQTASDRYLADYERTILSVSKDDDILLGNIKNRLAISHCQRGHFNEALREASESLDHYRQTGLVHGEFFAHLHMGTAYFAQARVREARDSYAAARATWRNALDEEKTKQALLHAHILELDYERAEHALSMRRLTETMGVFEHCEWWYDAFAALAIPLVMTLLATQGPEAALDALGHCRALVEQRQAIGLLPLFDAVEISCFALSGAVVRAREKLDACGFTLEHYLDSENDEISWRQGEAVAGAIARVYIRDGRAKTAAEFLKPIVELRASRGHFRSAIRLGLLHAIALEVAEDFDKSRQALVQVIGWAAPAGYARGFIEEGLLALNLLDRNLPTFSEETDQGEFLDRLTLLTKKGGASLQKPMLSKRELAVILHVARGLTDKEIARELDLAPNTIKFHLKNIFRKLGARNRTQAVAYSQGQGLLG